MTNAPNSIPELISMFGTITAFAAEVGCGYEAARAMRSRQRISPEHWERLILACNARDIPGVSLVWLVRQWSAEKAAA